MLQVATLRFSAFFLDQRENIFLVFNRNMISSQPNADVTSFFIVVVLPLIWWIKIYNASFVPIYLLITK